MLLDNSKAKGNVVPYPDVASSRLARPGTVDLSQRLKAGVFQHSRLAGLCSHEIVESKDREPWCWSVGRSARNMIAVLDPTTVEFISAWGRRKTTSEAWFLHDWSRPVPPRRTP